MSASVGVALESTARRFAKPRRILSNCSDLVLSALPRNPWKSHTASTSTIMITSTSEHWTMNNHVALTVGQWSLTRSQTAVA